MATPKQRGRKSDPGAERRREPRLPPSVIPSLKSARILAGPEVQLLNISRGGMLLETDSRVMPGASVCIRLVAADAVFLLRGKVVRSRASELRGSVLLYQSAVMFDEPFPAIFDETPSHAALEQAAAEALENTVAGSAPEATPEPVAESEPAVITVTAAVPNSGRDLRQIFGLNGW